MDQELVSFGENYKIDANNFYLHGYCDLQMRAAYFYWSPIDGCVLGSLSGYILCSVQCLSLSIDRDIIQQSSS